MNRVAAVALVIGAFAWPRAAGAAKIACVGDSITFGYGLSNPNQESYPARLQALLGAEHSVRNFGVGGATLMKSGDNPYWIQPAYATSAGFGPDIVIVMLGTNDAKPQNWPGAAEFADDYHELVGYYRELGAFVYLATPPPVYAPGAFDIPADVVNEEVVPRVRQIALDVEAPIIDVFTDLSDAPEYFPDTVHPNADGAIRIAESVHAALEATHFGESGGTGGSVASGAGAAGTPADAPTASGASKSSADDAGCALHGTQRRERAGVAALAFAGALLLRLRARLRLRSAPVPARTAGEMR